MMPLRGMLIFPHVVTHLDVGRDRSINAINEAMEDDKNLLFLQGGLKALLYHFQFYQ